MRFVSLFFVLIVQSALVGCGNKGPTVPVAMTPEQEQKFREDERKAANEEQRHHAELRTNAPLTSEQQAELAEQQHRRR